MPKVRIINRVLFKSHIGAYWKTETEFLKRNRFFLMVLVDGSEMAFSFSTIAERDAEYERLERDLTNESISSK